MGTLSFPGLATAQIKATSSNDTLTIGQATFPAAAAAPPRATASFGSGEDSVASFVARSQRQEVTTSTAVVGVGISIVGVNFDGPVTLTFADSGVDINDLHIVDEGGFCSPSKKITTVNESGTMQISNPFSSMRLRISGGKSIPEAVAPVITEEGESLTENPDGSITEVDAEGNSTTTLVEGGTTTTQEVLADGTTVATVAQSNGSSTTYSVLPDGTTIDVAEASNGNLTSYTVYPDGSTVDADIRNNGRESVFTTLADGTTIDAEESRNGNTSQVTVSPEGNVDTQVTKSNGTIRNSTVNVDGSSYSFVRSTNGKITITTVDEFGTEVKEYFVPWKSTYTVTTTRQGQRRGTTQTLSPNPYAS